MDSPPLVILTELAVEIGLNEAVVLQQVHYWIQLNVRGGRNYHDSYYWTYNTYSQWQKQFPFWTEAGVKKIITRLENVGLLVTGNYNKHKMDKTKWYRVNYELLEERLGKKIDGRIISGIGGIRCISSKGYDVSHGQPCGFAEITPEEVNDIREIVMGKNLEKMEEDGGTFH